MSRFQARQLLLGCTADEVVLLAEPESTTAAAELLASLPVDPSPSALSAPLCAALQALQPTAPLPPASKAQSRFLTVTLDDSLARSFVVTPPRGARGLRELRATAEARFATLYGELAEQWLLVADWHASAPFIACALPRQLCQALDALAEKHSWRLDSLGPAFVRVSNRLCESVPANGWLLVGFGQTLTLLGTRNDQPATMRSLRLPGAPDFAALETLVTQERLRSPPQGTQGEGLSLLWAGAADWLPAADRVASLESRLLPLRGLVRQGAGGSVAGQLALAGSRR